MVPAKRNSWKSTHEKKEYGKKFLFFAGTWKEFPRIPGAGKPKKGTQKGMHNLALWWWLSICHLEGNFYFQIPQKIFGDLFQRSHFFSSSANLKTWLPTQPLELMPFPFEFAWLNALQAAVRHSHNYQTHVFAKLHKQIEHWLRLKKIFGQQLKQKEIELQWRLFGSSWCYWQSFFWQVMQLHF
jgi:hypothetical protein